MSLARALACAGAVAAGKRPFGGRGLSDCSDLDIDTLRPDLDRPAVTNAAKSTSRRHGHGKYSRHE
jgi:hypothetical protein